jgi:hypothetical protein
VGIDETTDLRCHSQLAVAYRIVDSETGKLSHIFGGLNRLPAGDAVTTTVAVKKQFRRDDVHILKVGSICSDGGSQVIGVNEGVQTRLLNENPCMVGAHCSAHCLPLCVKPALEIIPAIKKFFETTQHLGEFFKVGFLTLLLSLFFFFLMFFSSLT